MRRPRGTGRIYQPKGSSLWWIKFYRNGEPFRESTGTSDKRKATRALNQRLAEVTTGKFLGPVIERVGIEERVGRIDHATLETWVYSPQKLDLSDPRYLHVLTCAECTRELMELRKRRNEEKGRVGVTEAARATNGRRGWRWAGIAAAILCCLAIGGVAFGAFSPND